MMTSTHLICALARSQDRTSPKSFPLASRFPRFRRLLVVMPHGQFRLACHSRSSRNSGPNPKCSLSFRPNWIVSTLMATFCVCISRTSRNNRPLMCSPFFKGCGYTLTDGAGRVTWFLRKAVASSLERYFVCSVARFGDAFWFATPRIPPLWQRGFFW